MKEKIEEMYIQALIDDLPPNVFADQVLRLFDVSGSLPKNTTIWKKAREMEFAYFRKWWFSRVGNDR